MWSTCTPYSVASPVSATSTPKALAVGSVAGVGALFILDADGAVVRWARRRRKLDTLVPGLSFSSTFCSPESTTYFSMGASQV